MKNLQISGLLQSEQIVLTPKEAAAVLGCNPESIRGQAREDPQMLGFPVCVMGTRVLIPRLSFLKWLGYEEEMK